MSNSWNPQAARTAYQRVLLPHLCQYKPLIELDARNEFYLSLIADQHKLCPGTHLVDLGAGLSVFGPVCRALGLRVTLVDDFGGGGGIDLGQPATEVPLLRVFEEQFRLEIARLNFLENPLPFPAASIDVVTCFHSLEHWHHSPRPLFHEIRRVLKPGGLLVIATPNAVNIRKRFYVLLGRTNFPSLNEWYNDGCPVYRGHVREPVVADLERLLLWNDFDVVSVKGRNFIGRRSEALSGLPTWLTEFLASFSDRIIRLLPTLCSDIHVVGRRR